MFSSPLSDFVFTFGGIAMAMPLEFLVGKADFHSFSENEKKQK
jgi:hypothetical protein